MGDRILVVSINGTAYIIKSGHNNNDQKAIEIALEKRKADLIKENEYYRKHDIRNENNNPIFIEDSISEVYVCSGIEIN